MIFERLADAIMKNPKQIIVAWIIIILCAVPLAMGAGDALKYDVQDVAVKESESVIGLTIINDYFYKSDVSIADSPILVLQSDLPKDEAAIGFQTFIDLLEGNRAGYKDAEGNEKILNFAYDGKILSSGESGGSLAMLVVFYSPSFTGDDTSDLRDMVSRTVSQYAAGSSTITFSTYVTGFDAINHDTQVGTMADLAKIEPVTIIMILILIGLFFRSAISAATPPITIGLAFGITLSLVFLLGQFMDIFFITEMLMLVTMMGAGCDYCIFILARYKEERRSGKDHQISLRNSIVWAGESITISGMTVIIGFGSISLISVPMINTMGIVLALGIAIALMAALTLITSIIAVIGDKIFWPSKTENFKEDGKTMKGWYGKISHVGSAYFHKSARFTQDHAKAVVIAAILITVPAAYVVATAETSYDFMGTLSTGESYEGLQMVDGYLGGGFLQPNYVLVEFNEPIADIQYIETSEGKVPIFIWADNDGYDKVQSLTSQLGPLDNGGIENIISSSGVMKWNDPDTGQGIIQLAKGSYDELPPTLMHIINSIPDPYVKEALKAHAIAGISLTIMPTESVLYATGALEEIGLDRDLLNILNAMRSSDHPNTGALEEYFHNNSPVLTVDALEKDYLAPVMDYAINYMGGTLGGVVTAGGTMELTHAKITSITESSSTSNRSMRTLDEIEGIVSSFSQENSEAVVSTWITGAPAITYDLSKSVADDFQYVGIVVIVLILILLLVAMKSYIIPIRSVLTILMGVVWTIALTNLLFVGLLGVDIVWLVPLILFIICLGIGMDYDILLTTRIRENAVHLGMDNDKAIYEAVTHTGSVITICGLIMGGAFGTLMLSSMPMMQEFGFSLCVAILVDALIIRTYVVPAVMHLLGKWNWIGPKWLQKVPVDQN